MKKQSYQQIVFCSLVSGILTAMIFPPFSFSYLAWFSLVPWFYSLSQCKLSLRQMFLSSFLFYATFFGIGIFWISAVHPICLVAIFSLIYLACLPFPFLFHWIAQRKRISLLVAGSALWVLDEYLRSFLLTGFPYLYLGHSQAFHPQLIQISDITGVYGISFLIVSINLIFLTWIHWWISHRTEIRTTISTPVSYTIIIVIFLILTSWYGSEKLDSIKYDLGPKIASLQGNIPQDIKDDPRLNQSHILDSYTRLSVEALKQKPAMLIWPETMSPEDPCIDPQIHQMLYDLSHDTATSLLIGSHHIHCDFAKARSKVYNSAYFYDKTGKICGRYDKIRLVMVGEYIPLQNIFPFLPIIIQNLVGFAPNLVAGKKRPVFQLGKYPFGCQICYDIAYSQETRILRQQGCRFIVNMTNEGWFFDTAELEQLLAISIFRAVENRIGILRATNTGITLNIPPTGIIKKKNTLTIPIKKYLTALPSYLRKRIHGKKTIAWHHLPQALWNQDIHLFTTMDKDWDIMWQGERLKWKDFEGIFCQKVPLATKEMTFYTQYGDIFCYLLVAILFGMFGYQFSGRFFAGRMKK